MTRNGTAETAQGSTAQHSTVKLPLLCQQKSLHVQFTAVIVPCASCRVRHCQEWCRALAGPAGVQENGTLEGCKWAHLGTVPFSAHSAKQEKRQKSIYQISA